MFTKLIFKSKIINCFYQSKFIESNEALISYAKTIFNEKNIIGYYIKNKCICTSCNINIASFILSTQILCSDCLENLSKFEIVDVKNCSCLEIHFITRVSRKTPRDHYVLECENNASVHDA